MNNRVNAKLVMLEHSKAKVELYSKYLATYLNILSRTSFVNTIHIYDLMCGEGVYSDNSKGSPVVALEKIREHFFYNNKTCPNLNIWFNDKDKSEIDKKKYKIERVKEKCAQIFKPDNVNIEYTKEDYLEIYPKIIQRINSFNRTDRLLIFIDPYGYKEIKPNHLKEFLSNGKIEVILFLPISYMYRFVKKSLSNEDFPGGVPLQEFLKPLIDYNNKIAKAKSTYNFILQLKESFKEFLDKYSIFVDTFTIERDAQNIYCLFFFTSHIRGFEKMLEIKWQIDEDQGRGFRLERGQNSFFSEIEISGYENRLKEYILNGKTKTNADLYKFGLENGFLPKHTNQVLRDWQNNNAKFKVYLENGNEARKNSFYLQYQYHHGNNPKRIVKFIFQ